MKREGRETVGDGKEKGGMEGKGRGFRGNKIETPCRALSIPAYTPVTGIRINN